LDDGVRALYHTHNLGVQMSDLKFNLYKYLSKLDAELKLIGVELTGIKVRNRDPLFCKLLAENHTMIIATGGNFSIGGYDVEEFEQ